MTLRLRTKAASGVLLAALLLVCVSTASAAPILFNNRALFLAAAGGGLSFEGFENSPGSFAARYDFPGFSVEETNGINALTNVAINGAFGTTPVTEGRNAIWYDDNGNSVSTFFNFAGPVNAFGLDVTTSANSSVSITGGSLNALINLSANTPSFFGVIDTTGGFSSIAFDASGAPLVGFDAVNYGQVPAPATVTLLGLGLAGLRLARRSRKRSV